MKPVPSETSETSPALYRAVWRWHFFAGLLVAPFAIFLAITGAIYLWKPQYEAWRYRDLFTVPVPATAKALSADEQFTAARAAAPTLNPIQFLPALKPGRTAEVQFGAARGPEKTSVFVNPYTGAVVGKIVESERLMTIVHDLHGTLLAGTFGQLIVELAASWAFVLLITGFYLWWPRPFSAKGFLWPRFGEGRRAFLRDLHAVPAVWLSALILFLLVTGIQWTKVAGTWSRIASQAIGQWTPKETNASAHRSELLGGWSPPVADHAVARQLENVSSTPPAADPHAEHRMKGAAFRDDPSRISLERVMAIARERRVLDDYAIAFPNGPTGVYSILSDRNRAFSRAYVHVDQYSGKVLADVRFKDFGFMGKFYMFGIIAHEGQLFGLANQLLGVVACAGVILLAVTGIAMWWARRPKGQLAAPVASTRLFQASKPSAVIAIGLSLIAPLMGLTLLVLLAVELGLERKKSEVRT